MQIDDYLLLREGWLNKLVREERIARRATYSMIAPHVKKMPPLLTWWPIYKDEELKGEQKSAMTEKNLALLAKFRQEAMTQRALGKLGVNPKRTKKKLR
jgi:hypothetical protein